MMINGKYRKRHEIFVLNLHLTLWPKSKMGNERGDVHPRYSTVYGLLGDLANVTSGDDHKQDFFIL